MDEIIIEEKRYLSSKQAAKVTGYAKDYVGQLCREGRVPARLVGRNWYVLEAAIHDHRFGSPAVTPMNDMEAPEPSQEFESPKYEAFSADVFPQITHSRQDGSESIPTNGQNDASEHLQDSWKEWFERIADTAASVIPDVATTEKSHEKVEAEGEEEEIVANNEEEKRETMIPIRAIHHSRYETPPEELLPRRRAEQQARVVVMDDNDTEHEISAKSTWATKKGMVMTIRVASISIALIVAILAGIGSGYFDAYIISYSRASVITGITEYNK